jgi:hypothetical protein
VPPGSTNGVHEHRSLGMHLVGALRLGIFPLTNPATECWSDLPQKFNLIASLALDPRPYSSDSEHGTSERAERGSCAQSNRGKARPMCQQDRQRSGIVGRPHRDPDRPVRPQSAGMFQGYSWVLSKGISPLEILSRKRDSLCPRCRRIYHTRKNVVGGSGTLRTSEVRRTTIVKNGPRVFES